MDVAGIDCGCGTRKETIGSNNWWNGVIVGGGILFICLTKGGAVTKQTKNLIGIASAGAIMALVADKVVNPRLKG